VIARKGLLAATIVDIAEEAERAPATLYLYFASKLDLAYVLARQFDSEAAHPATAASELAERSGDQVRENIAVTVGQFWQTFSEQLPVAVGAFQLAMVEPGFAAEWAEIRRAVTQRFTRAIQRLQDRGESPAFDPVPVASAISGMLFHSAIVAQFFGGERDDESMLGALTEIWYRGVTQFGVNSTTAG
jgi:AcrR family transcriptional regulator